MHYFSLSWGLDDEVLLNILYILVHRKIMHQYDRDLIFVASFIYSFIYFYHNNIISIILKSDFHIQAHSLSRDCYFSRCAHFKFCFKISFNNLAILLSPACFTLSLWSVNRLFRYCSSGGKRASGALCQEWSVCV